MPSGIIGTETRATNAEIRRDCDEALDRAVVLSASVESSNKFSAPVQATSQSMATNAELRYDIDYLMSWIIVFEESIGIAPAYYVIPVIASPTRSTNAELRNDLDVASAALTWLEGKV